LAHHVETPWPKWMALCQNVRRSLPYIFDCTSRRWEETGTIADWSTIGEIEKTVCVTHFWPTLQNHVTDGSKHMRQLDRGEIKLFSSRCLYASIFNSFWDIWTKVSKWWKIRNFFEVFGPPCKKALADLDGCTTECAQVCALHTGPHLASLRKIEMVAVLCMSETTPNFLSCELPLPRPPGADGPHRGGDTSADIVPTQIIFGVDPCTRCWDIAQKPPKCKNSPLTPIVTKISFAPFSAAGAANPQNGRRHIRNQSTPACELWRESAGGLSRNRWPNKQKKTKKHTVKQIPRLSL